MIMQTKAREEAILEKVSIMIDIMMALFNMSYSDCYALIVASNTYNLMLNGDISALHDSPQANLIEIGKELRNCKNPIGSKLTEETIKEYAKSRLQQIRVLV